MSEEIRFQTQIKSIKLLNQAISLLNMDLIKDKTITPDKQIVLEPGLKVRGYTKYECEFGITLPGNFDLGIAKSKEDDTYTFVGDHWLLEEKYSQGKEGRKIIGAEGGKLLQYYFLAQTKQQSAGKRVTHQWDGRDLLIDVHVGAR